MFSFLRSNKMLAVSRELDMDYFKYLPYGDMLFLEVFELFQKGKKQKIRNVLSGYAGHLDVDIDIFDFGFSHHDEYKWQSVALLRGPKLDIPQFIMRPTHLGDKFMEIFSGGDINFDLYPRFSRNYFVKGPHETDIRYLMNEPFLEYFNARPNWCLEGLKDMFVIYRRRKRCKPADVPGFYDMAIDVCTRILEGGKAGGYL